MTIQEFIDENHLTIDECIHAVNPDYLIDNDERELWIMNDESLYNWAMDSGL